MPTIEDAARLISEIDANVKAIEADAANQVKALKLKRETLEKWMNKKFLDEGLQNVKTPYGTVYFTTTAYCSVADWDATWNWITSNDKYEVLNHAVSKSAISEIVKSTGEVPPGLNYGTKRTMCMQKARKGPQIENETTDADR